MVVDTMFGVKDMNANVAMSAKRSGFIVFGNSTFWGSGYTEKEAWKDAKRWTSFEEDRKCMKIAPATPALMEAIRTEVWEEKGFLRKEDGTFALDDE